MSIQMVVDMVLWQAFSDCHTDILICGGMLELKSTQSALVKQVSGIFGGVSGLADEVVLELFVREWQYKSGLSVQSS